MLLSSCRKYKFVFTNRKIIEVLWHASPSEPKCMVIVIIIHMEKLLLTGLTPHSDE